MSLSLRRVIDAYNACFRVIITLTDLSRFFDACVRKIELTIKN